MHTKVLSASTLRGLKEEITADLRGSTTTLSHFPDSIPVVALSNHFWEDIDRIVNMRDPEVSVSEWRRYAGNGYYFESPPWLNPTSRAM